MALPLKNFMKIKASPPKNSIFFYSTPKEILNFYDLPLENSLVLQPGGADIKCDSPPGAPLTYFNDGGGVRQRFIFYTPKNPNFRICLPKKISTFFSIPKKIPQCFCIRKFYYLSSEISESATHLCMGLYYYVFLAFIFT